MKTELKEIERCGDRIIKYRRNLEGTKHDFLYKYKGKYYTFTKFKGQLMLNWLSDKKARTTLIDSIKLRNLKTVKEWFNSSLNEWYNEKHEWYVNKFA